MNDESRLLSDLGEAIRAAQAVPADFLAAGKAAIGWRITDADFAMLTHDSDHLVGTRTAQTSARNLEFVTGDAAISAELRDGGLFGQVIPPGAGDLALHRRDGQVAQTTVDEVGWFAFPEVSPGLYRLRLQLAGREAIVTEWFTVREDTA